MFGVLLLSAFHHEATKLAAVTSVLQVQTIDMEHALVKLIETGEKKKNADEEAEKLLEENGGTACNKMKERRKNTWQ